MPATLLKKRLWHGCFLVNFAKFLRTYFLCNTSGPLLLKSFLQFYMKLRATRIQYSQRKRSFLKSPKIFLLLFLFLHRSYQNFLKLLSIKIDKYEIGKLKMVSMKIMYSLVRYIGLCLTVLIFLIFLFNHFLASFSKPNGGPFSYDLLCFPSRQFHIQS